MRPAVLLLPLAALLLGGLASLPGADARPAPPRVATLPIPGQKAFVRTARDVVDVAVSIDPSLASGSALFDDAVRVPSFTPAQVHALTARLDTALHDLPPLMAKASVDEQIDIRWVYAVAETLRHALLTEKLYEHRPAQWLEPVGNNLVNLASYAPERPELSAAVWARVPAMLDEMKVVATAPTRRDVTTALRLVDALTTMATAQHATEAVAALAAYRATLASASPVAESTVIGPEAYAWRLKHAMLLPWGTEELLSRAQADLAAVDTRIAALPPKAEPAPATAEETALASALTREKVLALYDGIEEANRAATIRGGWVTIPPEVGPIRARETPDAMVPLTGDGGSMNPPPTYWSSNVGYWNVEHFNAAMTPEERLGTVMNALRFLQNGMGPYAAHEGFPGHHLQLAIARLHPDPLRSILPDPVQNEGWGLYAEGVFWEHGGLGTSPDEERAILGSFRHRIRRVVYDVNIETGRWSLQDGADYKYGTEPGKAPIDEELMRSINWPTQLACYYSGKAQIMALKTEYREKMGAAYDERVFHDAFLHEGSIPIALIRAKLLGEPVPAMGAQ